MRARWQVTAALLVISALAGCTKQQRARSMGGEYAGKLGPCQVVIGATWKDNSALWVLTRSMEPGDKPRTIRFAEDSSLGWVEGTVTFNERRDKSCPEEAP